MSSLASRQTLRSCLVLGLFIALGVSLNACGSVHLRPPTHGTGASPAGTVGTSKPVSSHRVAACSRRMAGLQVQRLARANLSVGRQMACARKLLLGPASDCEEYRQAVGVPTTILIQERERLARRLGDPHAMSQGELYLAGVELARVLTLRGAIDPCR